MSEAVKHSDEWNAEYLALAQKAAKAEWDAASESHADALCEDTIALMRDVLKKHNQGLLSVAVDQQTQLRSLRRLAEMSCKGCDYDEAEGGLVNHCDKCCRRITTALWKATHGC